MKNKEISQNLTIVTQEVSLINTSKKDIPEKYYVYIPKELVIDELIRLNPPDIKHFHKDKLAYIISLINSIPVRLKDYDIEEENGYVPINSEVLKSRVREYNKYLEYLVNVGVLEKRNDFKYLSGTTSSGYRYKQRYICDSVKYPITLYTL